MLDEREEWIKHDIRWIHEPQITFKLVGDVLRELDDAGLGLTTSH